MFNKIKSLFAKEENPELDWENSQQIGHHSAGLFNLILGAAQFDGRKVPFDDKASLLCGYVFGECDAQAQENGYPKGSAVGLDAACHCFTILCEANARIPIALLKKEFANTSSRFAFGMQLATIDHIDSQQRGAPRVGFYKILLDDFGAVCNKAYLKEKLGLN